MSVCVPDGLVGLSETQVDLFLLPLCFLLFSGVLVLVRSALAVGGRIRPRRHGLEGVQELYSSVQGKLGK